MRGQRSINYWYNVYRIGLKEFGVEIKELKRPTKKSIARVRKQYKQTRKKYQAEVGIKPPTIREAYKRQTAIIQEQALYQNTERDIDTNRTIETPTAEQMTDYSKETVEQFIDMVKQIYNDTIEYIKEYTQTGVTHEEGRLASIASKDYNMNAITASYEALISKIEKMREEYGDDMLSDAINDNPELDYAIAITLQPPSDIEVEFDNTLEWLDGLTVQFDARAQELAEQAEREYYGQ